MAQQRPRQGIITGPTYHARANRALVRAHLEQWDFAIKGAKKVLSLPFSDPSFSLELTVALGRPTLAFSSYRTCSRTTWPM